MDLENSCQTDGGIEKISLGLFIIAGLLISYIPQIVKLARSSSSQGLSLWFLLLGALGCFSTFGNVILLQTPSFECCVSVNVLGVVQIAGQLFCFLTICILYFKNFPEDLKWDTPVSVDSENPSIDHRARSRLWERALVVSKVIFLYGTLVITVVSSIVTTRLAHWHKLDMFITSIATFLGLFATCTGIVQFLPQIIHTATEKKAGALSILMMVMQCPGSFVFAASLAVQPGTNWTTWISFIVSGTLQGVLLAMCIYFEYFKKTSATEAETSPLLDESSVPPTYAGEEVEEEVEDDPRIGVSD